MTERLQELLAKLEKLDPGTFGKIRASLTVGGTHINPLHPIGMAIIQGIIQNAISARGWHFYVCYNEVTKEYVSLATPSDNETWFDYIEADAPAEALLGAYIQAIEAEAAR